MERQTQREGGVAKGEDRKPFDSVVCEARRAADGAGDAIAERRVQVLPQPFRAFQANVVRVPARQRARVCEQHEAHLPTEERKFVSVYRAPRFQVL